MALLQKALQFKEKISKIFPYINPALNEYEEGGCNLVWFSDEDDGNSTIELRFLNSVDYSFNLGRFYVSYPNMESKDHIFTFNQYEEVIRDIMETGGSKFLEYPLPNITHMGYDRL